MSHLYKYQKYKSKYFDLIGKPIVFDDKYLKNPDIIYHKYKKYKSKYRELKGGDGTFVIDNINKISASWASGADTIIYKLNEPLYNGIFISKIKKIIFDDVFNQPIGVRTKTFLPKNLVTVTFGKSFQQSIEPLMLPSSLTEIIFDDEYNKQSLDILLNSSHTNKIRYKSQLAINATGSRFYKEPKVNGVNIHIEKYFLTNIYDIVIILKKIEEDTEKFKKLFNSYKTEMNFSKVYVEDYDYDLLSSKKNKTGAFLQSILSFRLKGGYESLFFVLLELGYTLFGLYSIRDQLTRWNGKEHIFTAEQQRPVVNQTFAAKVTERTSKELNSMWKTDSPNIKMSLNDQDIYILLRVIQNFNRIMKDNPGELLINARDITIIISYMEDRKITKAVDYLMNNIIQPRYIIGGIQYFIWALRESQILFVKDSQKEYY